MQRNINLLDLVCIWVDCAVRKRISPSKKTSSSWYSRLAVTPHYRYPVISQLWLDYVGLVLPFWDLKPQ